MRALSLGLLLMFTTGLVAGCGGASGIEAGIPKNVTPPADFDPGGDAKPNMTGKTAK
ncbi:MAG: hypothetical protein U0800_01185 [Isosphaeraceae bacterium]